MDTATRPYNLVHDTSASTSQLPLEVSQSLRSNNHITSTPNATDDASSCTCRGCARCCQRTKLAHCPIDKWILSFTDNAQTGKQDASLEIVLVPEAFRMWFYYGLWIFLILSIFISIMWADIPYDDTPFIKYFNANNICVFFDYPPFNYFACILWLPIAGMLIIYELLDQFRVYDAYHDKEISHRFYQWYTACTIFESVSFVCVTQVFATTPQENWIIHTVPYLMLTYALWTMAVKRFMYLRKTGILDQALSKGQKWVKLKLWAGWLYVISMGVVVVLKTACIWPNMFGLRLWTKAGWEWTDMVLMRSAELWMIMVLVVPIIIYWVVTEDLQKIKFVVNRVPWNTN